MFPLKAIIALSMIFSSLAVGLVEPMPEAVAAAPVEAENAVAPREIELPNPLQACTPAGGSCKTLAALTCCTGYVCMATGSLSGTCQLLSLTLTTTLKATATKKPA